MIKSLIELNRRMSTHLGKTFPFVFGGPSYHEVLLENIRTAIASENAKVVMEVGGVNRPLLQRSDRYQYVGVDIDDQPDCHSLYDKFVVQSVEKPLPVKADIILSITLLEHVPNNKAAARSMFESMNIGGSTHHYVPSMWHPYAICLRVVGPRLQKVLIRQLRPDAVGVSGYPTFFDFCTPNAMKKLFENTGFCDVKVIPFYRATDYFSFFLPAYLAVAIFENLTQVLGWSFFASGFVISAKKPR